MRWIIISLLIVIILSCCVITKGQEATTADLLTPLVPTRMVDEDLLTPGEYKKDIYDDQETLLTEHIEKLEQLKEALMETQQKIAQVQKQKEIIIIQRTITLAATTPTKTTTQQQNEIITTTKQQIQQKQQQKEEEEKKIKEKEEKQHETEREGSEHSKKRRIDQQLVNQDTINQLKKDTELQAQIKQQQTQQKYIKQQQQQIKQQIKVIQEQIATLQTTPTHETPVEQKTQSNIESNTHSNTQTNTQTNTNIKTNTQTKNIEKKIEKNKEAKSNRTRKKQTIEQLIQKITKTVPKQSGEEESNTFADTKLATAPIIRTTTEEEEKMVNNRLHFETDEEDELETPITTMEEEEKIIKEMEEKTKESKEHIKETIITSMYHIDHEKRKPETHKIELLKSITGKTTIVGHRGASGDRPEHSLEAYELAIQQGADYIEQDVVMTKDGEIIVCHDRELSGYTDIEMQSTIFGEKTTKKKVDHEEGKPKYLTDWFAEDYNWTDIKKLNVIQRYPFRSQAFNGLYRIHTLREVLKWVKASHPTIGLYVELKNPSYLEGLGLSFRESTLNIFIEEGWLVAHPQKENVWVLAQDKKLIIQCFEATTLRWFRERVEGVPLIQLVYSNLKKLQPDVPNETYEHMMTRDGLTTVATYADGIGPHKTHLFGEDNQTPSSLIQDAHAAGLAVHAYTFRADEFFLLPNTSYAQEIAAVMKQGIDGFFTDFPGVSRVAVTAYEKAAGRFGAKLDRWRSIVLSSVFSLEAGVTMSFLVGAFIWWKATFKSSPPSQLPLPQTAQSLS